MYKKVLAGVFGVLLLVLVILFVQAFIPSVKVVNNSTLKQFHISTIGSSVYLWKSGYYRQINRVTLTYSDEVQKGYSIKSADGSDMMSMWMRHQDKTVSVHIYYNPNTFADYQRNPGWLDRDVYAGICLAMESKTLGWQGCRDKANQYYQWAIENHIPSILKQNAGLFSFQLVKPVYAQACYGTIICGKEEWTCSCTNPGYIGIACPYGDGDCGNVPNSCNCGMGCNLDAGNDLDCSSLFDNQDYCLQANPVRSCDVGCNTNLENGCSWGTGTEPPTGCYGTHTYGCGSNHLFM